MFSETGTSTRRCWERQAGFYGCDVTDALVAPADLYGRVAAHVHDLPRAFRAFLATGELGKNKTAALPTEGRWAGFGAGGLVAVVLGAYLAGKGFGMW